MKIKNIEIGDTLKIKPYSYVGVSLVGEPMQVISSIINTLDNEIECVVNRVDIINEDKYPYTVVVKTTTESMQSISEEIEFYNNCIYCMPNQLTRKSK